jgi:ankyrin repeat protein
MEQIRIRPCSPVRRPCSGQPIGDVVELLLRCGAKVIQAMTDKGTTSLYAAAQENHVEVVDLLLDGGADINKAQNTGETPLFVAAKKGRVEMVGHLLGGGADINKALDTGETPLFVAAKRGHVGVVGLLLDGNADVKQTRSSDGATPLYIAAKEGRVEVVHLLLSCGADSKQTMSSRWSSLCVAAWSRHAGVIKLLLLEGVKKGVKAVWCNIAFSWERRKLEIESPSLV